MAQCKRNPEVFCPEGKPEHVGVCGSCSQGGGRDVSVSDASSKSDYYKLIGRLPPHGNEFGPAVYPYGDTND